jgi:hypothetical protein
MSKLKGENLQALAGTLNSNQALSSKQLCNIKGGCSSCEDTRRPPRIDGGC